MSRNPASRARFLAHFKHSLLFNPSLLFSDSMVINNSNFRHLLESDTSFRELIQPESFCFAVRDDGNGHPRNLIELRQDFIQHGKSRVTELDSSDAGLEYLCKTIKPIRYSAAKLSEIFRQRSIQIFEEDAVQERLDNGIWQAVRSAAEEARERLGAKFGLNFFFYELQDVLKDRRPDVNIDQYMEEIKQIAQHPYVTALPEAINTMSIYAKKHSRAFELCGGRSLVESVDGRPELRSFELRTGLTSFAKGIEFLSSQDIIELRSRSEAFNYFDARLNIDVSRYEETKSTFVHALSSYIYTIEDRILERFGRSIAGACDEINVIFDVKEKKLTGLLSGFDHAADQFTYVSVAAAAVGYSIEAFLSLLFVSPVKKVLSVALTGKTRSEALEETRQLASLQKQELHDRWSQDDRLPYTETVFTSGDKNIPGETLYTSDRIS